MSKIVSQLKSYSPIVKKNSHWRVKQELEDQIYHLNKEIYLLKKSYRDFKDYQIWLKKHFPKNSELKQQKQIQKKFSYRPLISFIVPVYNTNPDYLKVCLDSMLNQTYDNFEICLVDDKSNNIDTINVLNFYNKKYPQIKLKFRFKNGHISRASNDAIKMASGEYLALVDHDDYLWPNALFEIVKLLQVKPELDFIYTDSDKINEDAYDFIHFEPFFKPGWSPYFLLNSNYIAHFAVFRKKIQNNVLLFDPNLNGAQDWDLFFKITEKTNNIAHIENVLYSWRAHINSTALTIDSKPYAIEAQRIAIKNHLQRTKKYQLLKQLKCRETNTWSLIFKPQKNYKISIIIPTKDKVEYLKKCLNSILNKTTYNNFEIIIVDTGSKETKTKNYYQELKNNHLIQLVDYTKEEFNYSETCNFGASLAKGDFLVMLNNDTEVVSPEWLEIMLGYAQFNEVGAVGVKLLYPDNGLIQHAGICVSYDKKKKIFYPKHCYYQQNYYYLKNNALELTINRDIFGVTAACLMIKKNKFNQVGGFDPKFRVHYNDVDLNLKLLQNNFKNIYLEDVTLVHHESISVGLINDNKDMIEFEKSFKLINQKFKKLNFFDYYNNKNFCFDSDDFRINVE